MSISKQIEEYPSYYVSSAGNVWREKSNNFYLRLRPRNGRVNLWTNGERKPMLVYRLVAQAFVPIPEKYADMSIDELEVHHVDHNRNNNRASNLQWLTKKEHMQLHSDSKVTKQRKSKPNLALSKAVAQFTKEGEFVAEYASIHDAERLTKVDNSSISKCCNGKVNSAGGFKWRYSS